MENVIEKLEELGYDGYGNVGKELTVKDLEELGFDFDECNSELNEHGNNDCTFFFETLDDNNEPYWGKITIEVYNRKNYLKFQDHEIFGILWEV